MRAWWRSCAVEELSIRIFFAIFRGVFRLPVKSVRGSDYGRLENLRLLGKRRSFALE